MLRDRVDEAAARFDQQLATLGREEMSSELYAETIESIGRTVQNMTDDLTRIIEIGAQYSEQLAMELDWAQSDLVRLQEIKATLTAEQSDPY
jgi:hypothetical protein